MIQYLIGIFKSNITRWIIRTFFTGGELPLAKWYTKEFLLALNIPRITGLIAIASFTAITFPLGIWIASFELNKSFPVSRLLGIGIYMATFPVNIYIMNQKLQEFTLTRNSVSGIILTEIGYAIALLGAYFMWRGNNG